MLCALWFCGPVCGCAGLASQGKPPLFKDPDCPCLAIGKKMCGEEKSKTLNKVTRVIRG
jgi:hypothetical protein